MKGRGREFLTFDEVVKVGYGFKVFNSTSVSANIR
jgi:hypothetical protein